MNTQNPKKNLTLTDAKRALHAMMTRDMLRFPETPEEVDWIEAMVDESKVPTPDVNKFRHFLRKEASSQTTQESVACQFGQLLALLRRKHGYTIENLATVAALDATELHCIETDPNYEPELSTVHRLAMQFELPVKQLMKLSGLATDRLPICDERTLLFAASASVSTPLTTDEEQMLQIFLAAVLDQSDRK